MRGGGGNSLNSKVSSLSTQKECIFDLHEQKKKGFTLAETLITLTILGIVAALTVPNLVRRQVEASNRTKIKKAVGVYDSLMTKLTVQNNLKSNTAIQEWADDNCSNSSDLFKVVKFVSTGNNKCKFKTADGVFWDITDIQKPIIALKETDLNNETAQSDTNRAFYLFAEFDGTGILRVTEPTYDYTLSAAATNTKVNESVDRLIAFMKGATTTKLNEVEIIQPSPFNDCNINNQDTCTVDGTTFYKAHFNADSYTVSISGEDIPTSMDEGDIYFSIMYEQSMSGDQKFSYAYLKSKCEQKGGKVATYAQTRYLYNSNISAAHRTGNGRDVSILTSDFNSSRTGVLSYDPVFNQPELTSGSFITDEAMDPTGYYNIYCIGK